MYTPGQVSEMLEVSDSTLRRWAALFAEKLSDQQGRVHRLYTESDVLIFQQVKQQSNRNIPLDKIADRLEVIEVPTEAERKSTLALIPSISREIEAARADAAAALASLASMETAMSASSDRLDQLAAQVEEQRARIEKIDKYLSLSWLRRLFTPPPTL